MYTHSSSVATQLPAVAVAVVIVVGVLLLLLIALGSSSMPTPSGVDGVCPRAWFSRRR